MSRAGWQTVLQRAYGHSTTPVRLLDFATRFAAFFFERDATEVHADTKIGEELVGHGAMEGGTNAARADWTTPWTWRSSASVFQAAFGKAIGVGSFDSDIDPEHLTIGDLTKAIAQVVCIGQASGTPAASTRSRGRRDGGTRARMPGPSRNGLPVSGNGPHEREAATRHATQFVASAAENSVSQGSLMTETLYRAVKTLSATEAETIHRWRPTVRLPSNVSYMVDNLWEFLRPADMPCRRHAVYASPSAELAVQCAAQLSNPLPTAYVVAITGPYRVAQLDVEDAREHADLRAVRAMVQERQKEWTELPWDTRLRLGILFAPGATKADWERVIREDAVVAGVVAELSSVSTFWASAHAPVASSRGELFFELQDDASYQLRPLAAT
ncbi:hypothetical protein QTH97_26275 [Variovorax sp. J22R24]|uniref:hypothetical protein n=1 Tax=Variovorax gracilis TaxID=3053502 RepID=UPI002577A58B|nr:hypothetical protein [Variovorax sp. J22R24]MDM0108483.1 hypothetical protein [Variovorax sp. J22R24]